MPSETVTALPDFSLNLSKNHLARFAYLCLLVIFKIFGNVDIKMAINPIAKRNGFEKSNQLFINL